MKGKIEHRGVVERVEGSHVTVRIVQYSACSSCQAKAMCSSSDKKEKLIDVYTPYSTEYKRGDVVNVCASLTMGRNAVTLAFAIPLLTVILWALASQLLLNVSEICSALTSLAILAAYYVALGFFKDKISRKFSFWIERGQD